MPDALSSTFELMTVLYVEVRVSEGCLDHPKGYFEYQVVSLQLDPLQASRPCAGSCEIGIKGQL